MTEHNSSLQDPMQITVLIWVIGILFFFLSLDLSDVSMGECGAQEGSKANTRRTAN